MQNDSSLFSSNVAWLKSNLSSEKVLSYFGNNLDSLSLKNISPDLLDIEYVDPVSTYLDKPRKVSFVNIKSFSNTSNSNNVAADIVGSTDFTLLDYLLSLDNSEDSSYLNQVTTNLVLLGSFSLLAFEKRLNSNPHFASSLQSIILVESSPINFLSCLQYINFPSFISRLRSLNISFQFFLESEFYTLSEKFYQYVSDINPFLIYSLHCVSQPRLSPSLIKFEDWLFSQTGIGTRYAARLGFTTDEINQSLNALVTYNKYPNLKGFRCCRFDNSKLSVCTGSGPSLDSSLDWIKHNIDNLNIFSAGSSVKSLLSHGIVPNFLVINERNPIVYDYLYEVSQEFPELADVIFIGADTIDSKIFTLFKSSYVYQRPLSSVSPLFFENRFHALPIAGPEAINACFETCIFLGSSNILLLGCDLGSVSRNNPRSKNAFGLSPRALNIPVAGNKNKTIFSQASLLLVRDSINSVRNLFPRLNIIRAGEGALLTGVKHIELNDSITPDQLFQSNAISDLEPYPVDSSLDVHSVDNRQRCRIFRSAISEYLNELIQTVSLADTWSLALEIQLTSFLLPDLVDSTESTYKLAARRMLRQVVYHLLYQLYLRRVSPDSFGEAKNIFINQIRSCTHLIDFIYSTTEDHLCDSLLSSSNPLEIFVSIFADYSPISPSNAENVSFSS